MSGEDKYFTRVLRTILIVLFTLQLVSTLERQVFDFLGYMWAPIIGNFFQIIVVILGLFGACNFYKSFIVVYTVWNLLWLGWNIFVICLYLEVGILNRNRNLNILTIGAEGKSWWLEHGIGCKVTDETAAAELEEDDEDAFETTAGGGRKIPPESSVVGCILQYYYVEVIHAAVQVLLSVLGFVASSVSIYLSTDDEYSSKYDVRNLLTPFVRRRKRPNIHSRNNNTCEVGNENSAVKRKKKKYDNSFLSPSSIRRSRLPSLPKIPFPRTPLSDKRLQVNGYLPSSSSSLVLSPTLNKDCFEMISLASFQQDTSSSLSPLSLSFGSKNKQNEYINPFAKFTTSPYSSYNNIESPTGSESQGIVIEMDGLSNRVNKPTAVQRLFVSEGRSNKGIDVRNEIKAEDVAKYETDNESASLDFVAESKRIDYLLSKYDTNAVVPYVYRQEQRLGDMEGNNQASAIFEQTSWTNKAQKENGFEKSSSNNVNPSSSAKQWYSSEGMLDTPYAAKRHLHFKRSSNNRRSSISLKDHRTDLLRKRQNPAEMRDNISLISSFESPRLTNFVFNETFPLRIIIPDPNIDLSVDQNSFLDYGENGGNEFRNHSAVEATSAKQLITPRSSGFKYCFPRFFPGGSCVFTGGNKGGDQNVHDDFDEDLKMSSTIRRQSASDGNICDWEGCHFTKVVGQNGQCFFLPQTEL